MELVQACRVDFALLKEGLDGRTIVGHVRSPPVWHWPASKDGTFRARSFGERSDGDGVSLEDQDAREQCQEETGRKLHFR